MRYKCLSIAGFDGSGGAGIQADLKTFSATGSYGMTVLTALAVQNTVQVRSCYKISLNCIEQQLEAIFDDITPHAIKIGMLYSADVIKLVATMLAIKATSIPIILDPVMVAKSGDVLLKPSALSSLIKHLIPQVTLITPNLPEALAIIPGNLTKVALAREILALGCQAVLLKGGHDHSTSANDLFVSRDQEVVLSGLRIATHNTHGTGCTLSAAISSYIAQGYSSLAACIKAKSYLTAAIEAAKNDSVGKGQVLCIIFITYGSI